MTAWPVITPSLLSSKCFICVMEACFYCFWCVFLALSLCLLSADVSFYKIIDQYELSIFVIFFPGTILYKIKLDVFCFNNSVMYKCVCNLFVLFCIVYLPFTLIWLLLLVRVSVICKIINLNFPFHLRF